MNILLMSPSGEGSGIEQFMVLGAIFVVFYFFMMRPQMKKAKEAKKFREGLDKGQRIVTIGGVHGKIEEVKDSTVVISVEGGGRLKIEKAAISSDFTASIQSSGGELPKS